jgi:bifunctional non-homologous end joining protein LigD
MAKRARKAPANTLPEFVPPALAVLVDAPPDGGEWLFEVKFDGYRALAFVQDHAARLASRNAQDWTAKFRSVADALAALPLDGCILDGEVCVLDAKGRSSFQALQNALGDRADGSRTKRPPSRAQEPLVYFAFDLLFEAFEDIRHLPLRERKARLAARLGAAHDAPPTGAVRYSDHVEGSGAAFFAEACRHGLEGVLAKRADAPYRGRRTPDWQKVKCTAEQEVTICGFTPPEGGRKGFGALVVGVEDGGSLRYAGRVGTGFSNASLTSLARQLRALARDTPALREAPRIRGVTWVEPKLVAQVRFAEWTRDGRLRHPSFLGLREDKGPMETARESAVSGGAKTKRLARGVSISSPERVIDAPSGVTKGELVAYFDRVADRLLPYAKGRPLALVRCPNGRAGGCFFQKKKTAGMGSAIRRVRSEAGDELLVIDSAEGLIALAQMNTIELHAWGSRESDLEHPDWIVFDFDPDEALPFAQVRDAARSMRARLEALGLESFLKTTGGKGLHVVVPIRPRHDWELVKAFSKRLAERHAEGARGRYVTTMSKRARQGRIFIDYLRNGRGSTAILPYSPRARDGVTVAVPIAWEALDDITPGAFHLRNVTSWLVPPGEDPWRGFFSVRQSIPRKAIAELA